MKRLIKHLEFVTRARPTLTFSDMNKIRLNDDKKIDQGITLAPALNYDLGLTNTVTTPVMAPKALKKWLGFDADEVKPDGTTIQYRLLMGAAELYWDGSAWVAATTDSHWNTRAQVNTNIKDLVLTGFDLRIKVNLRTTDKLITPKVRWIKLLVQVDFDNWDDLIYDTVIRSLRDTLRATTAIQFEVAATTSSIDLASTYKLENSGYNFTGVKAAYDLTLDPNRFVNIAQAYTPGAPDKDGSFEDGQITLTRSINAGSILALEMEHQPEVAVYTGQDFYEPSRLPALAFESIQVQRVLDRHDQELNDGEGDFVRDFETGKAVEVPRPAQRTVRFDFAIHASPLDLAKMVEAVDRWMATTRLLRTWGFDEQINLDPVNEMDSSDKTNLEDVVMTTGSFQLRGVPFYIRDAKDGNLVLNVNVNGSLNP